MHMKNTIRIDKNYFYIRLFNNNFLKLMNSLKIFN